MAMKASHLPKYVSTIVPYLNCQMHLLQMAMDKMMYINPKDPGLLKQSISRYLIDGGKWYSQLWTLKSIGTVPINPARTFLMESIFIPVKRMKVKTFLLSIYPDTLN